MTADPDDLSARMIEAAARAYLDAPDPRDTTTCDVFQPITDRLRRGICAALAAAVREAGLMDGIDRGYLLSLLERRAEDGRRGGHTTGPAACDRLAALLRSLAGIADAE